MTWLSERKLERLGGVMDERLTSALRQYRHNSDAYPGFVVGYDKDEVDKLVAELRNDIARARLENDNLWNKLTGCDQVIRNVLSLSNDIEAMRSKAGSIVSAIEQLADRRTIS